MRLPFLFYLDQHCPAAHIAGIYVDLKW